MAEKPMEKELDDVVGGQTVAEKNDPKEDGDCLKAGSAGPLFSSKGTDMVEKSGFKPEYYN